MCPLEIEMIRGSLVEDTCLHKPHERARQGRSPIAEMKTSMLKYNRVGVRVRTTVCFEVVYHRSDNKLMDWGQISRKAIRPT